MSGMGTSGARGDGYGAAVVAGGEGPVHGEAADEEDLEGGAVKLAPRAVSLKVAPRAVRAVSASRPAHPKPGPGAAWANQACGS